MSGKALTARFGPDPLWRSTWLHGGLLVLALAGAWVSFERPFGRERPGDGDGVVVVQAAVGEVERLVRERGDDILTIEARRDDRGRWFFGREEDGAVFSGGRQIEALWRALEPLRAVRVLEGVSDEKLQELGLVDDDGASEVLTLTVRGREIRYRLGGRPFGGADRYARREVASEDGADAGGQVVVLPSTVTAALSGGGELLMERRLLRAVRPEVEVMTLERTTGGPEASLRIVQHAGAIAADSYWTVAGSGEANTDLATWVDKFFRLSAAAYRSDEPDPAWRPEAAIAVESREHGESRLKIWSMAAEDGRVWLARSPFTRLVVELSASLAEEVCADLDGLL